MRGFYKKVIALLALHGFLLVRQKGSHQTWAKGSKSLTVSTNCDSRHTANEILKQAEINHRF
ncbi:MAG: type II toxin-antitoxin system HicA family toxin [Zwartia sp.]